MLHLLLQFSHSVNAQCAYLKRKPTDWLYDSRIMDVIEDYDVYI